MADQRFHCARGERATTQPISCAIWRSRAIRRYGDLPRHRFRLRARIPVTRTNDTTGTRCTALDDLVVRWFDVPALQYLVSMWLERL
jgi:hypothetical protein